MSSFVSASTIRTMPLFGSEISLTLPSTAVWLCVSTIPGITYLPVASITRAPAGAAMSFPTAAILLPRMSTEPFSIVPFVIVRIVALRISVTRSCAKRVLARRTVIAAKRWTGDG
jgi:hypothetical protein